MADRAEGSRHGKLTALLEYTLRNSAKLRDIEFLRGLQAQGRSVPALDNMPPMQDGAEWLWVAFHTLSEKRSQSSDGPDPIKVSEIAAFADYTGVTDPWDRDLLLHVVGALDGVFVNYMREQIRKANQKRTGKRTFQRP